MATLILHGLYKISDAYFSAFPKKHWMDNKQENRPYYYLIQDSDGIDWVIPISSQVENYSTKIQREEAKRGKGNCIYYHLGKIASQPRAFLIGDMFPVDAAYIKAPFTLGAIHYVVKDTKLNAQIKSKAMRYLALLENGTMKSRNDVLGIKQILLNRRANQAHLI